MKNSEIEQIAKETCKTLGRFFAIYSMDINEENTKRRLLNGNNMASNFRKGKRKFTRAEYEKLMQLKSDYDNKNKLSSK